MPITVSGTAITFNDATTQTTAFTGGGGTVTSVATGNGLQGGTITTSGTLSVACPTYNTVGSYVWGYANLGNAAISAGANYSAGSGFQQIQSASIIQLSDLSIDFYVNNNLSGTWKNMGATFPLSGGISNRATLFCRVS
jgi:hypothetical protein